MLPNTPEAKQKNIVPQPSGEGQGSIGELAGLSQVPSGELEGLGGRFGTSHPPPPKDGGGRGSLSPNNLVVGILHGHGHSDEKPLQVPVGNGCKFAAVRQDPNELADEGRGLQDGIPGRCVGHSIVLTKASSSNEAMPLLLFRGVRLDLGGVDTAGSPVSC